MYDALQEIELFGLTENGTDDLPIPNDDELTDAIVRECFETLIVGLRETGLGSEAEPLAHAFATMLQRRAKAMDDLTDRLMLKIKGLIEAQDGSEIAETELENTRKAYEIAFDKSIALELMAEKAAQCYEAEIGKAYTPVTGHRTSTAARETGAVFEAKQLLDAHDRQKAERAKIEGPKIAVAGSPETTDHEAIYRMLDKTLAKHPGLVLCHKGHKIGTDRIAATWARNRKVTQVLFRPNFEGHGRAAPFRANDAVLAARPIGVIVFGGNGVALNLGQKAEEQGIPVLRCDVE